MRKKFVLLSAVGALVVAACAGAGSTGPGAGGGGQVSPGPKRVVAAIMDNPPSLNEKISTTGGGAVLGGAELERLVLVGLTQTDSRGDRQPVLAEAVPSVENGLWAVFPDGRMETTWRIKPEARWHDGTPLTIGDLLFTALVLTDRDIPLGRTAAFDSIETVAPRDDRTLVVTWKQPYIEADTFLGSSLMPMHLLLQTYKEEKPDFTRDPYWNVNFVGTGPFRLKEWVLGSHLVLSAYDQYVLGRPKIDEIEVKFIPDSNTLMANVLAGAVELTMGRGFSIEQGIQAREQWRDGQPLIQGSSWLVIYPQFLNPNPPIVANLAFRRGLMSAIDRQQMVDTIQAGLVAIAHSVLHSGEREYREIQESIARYDYDPRKAAQLIEGLGYTLGADRIYRDASGRRLELELRTIDTDINQKTMFSVADYWQRLGVAVDPVVIPRARQRDNEYRATFPAFDLLRQPNDVGSLKRLRGSQARLPENNYVGTNYSRYMNPEFDALIDRFHGTIPWQDRMEVLRQIVHHITDQLTLMGLYYDAQPIMVGKRVQNVTPESTGWNAHQWEVQ